MKTIAESFKEIYEKKQKDISDIRDEAHIAATEIYQDWDKKSTEYIFSDESSLIVIGNNLTTAKTPAIELMFKKENLASTFKALYKRQAELSEAMEWFDGSDGELEIIEESKYISAVFSVFGELQGITARQYFSLDQTVTEDSKCLSATI